MYPFFLTLSRGMAWLGGAMLLVLILLVCASVLGREANGLLHADAAQALAPGLAAWVLGLGIGPINGDFELVEAGIAFAIFAFLPLCQITGGHASVDILTQRFPDMISRGLRLVTDIVFAAVLVVMAQQLWLGMLSKKASGQTTFLLEMPVWWAYALSMTGAVAAAVVACYIAVERLREAATGRTILPVDLEADH
ncbi:Tripartite ATP-independent transporter, DctQ component [Loktanella fryxellensis]|uniref:TRAP transporter small permease protein n=1 Tax=Loktanella fryxellensis TaxID=245187 RepID=A0A1H8G8X8_9RHOB|nr:TRAP transporter small permease [Loktanella fryxellensis]SEN40210.1 Tripartite ATP-independent transporter, DctQ component [Loktanella fryxellensis]